MTKLPSSSPEDIPKWLSEEVQPFVNPHIERSLRNCRYSDRQLYQIKTGGKRLRPGVLMLIGELCGLDQQRLQDCAVGVELLHNFSLIHDDLIDGDKVRRNEPAFWVKYGRDDAINIGDLLLSHALSSFPEEATTRAIKATREMTIGQQLGFSLADRQNVSEDEYMEMVKKKTGSFFELCLDLPQTFTDTNLNIDGYNALWPAYQIRDDLLDFEAGKGRDAIGNDIREGKHTLMVIHADDERVYDILNKPTNATTSEDVATVQEIFAKTESFEYARQRMHTYATDALTALETLPDSPQRRRLTALARYCTDRGQ